MCLSFMKQIKEYWDMCVQQRIFLLGNDSVKNNIKVDSKDALSTLLVLEERLCKHLAATLRAIEEWCQLAGMCIKSMEALEIGDMGEPNNEEMKAKMQVYRALQKVHSGTMHASAVLPSATTGHLPTTDATIIMLGMPFSSAGEEDGYMGDDGSSCSDGNYDDKDDKHLLIKLAVTNVAHTRAAIQYVQLQGTGVVQLENLLHGLDVMHQWMVETGRCLDRVVQAMREAAKLYEDTWEFLGDVHAAPEKWHLDASDLSGGGGVEQHASGVDALRRWRIVFEMADTLI